MAEKKIRGLIRSGKDRFGSKINVMKTIDNYSHRFENAPDVNSCLMIISDMPAVPVSLPSHGPETSRHEELSVPLRNSRQLQFHSL